MVSANIWYHLTWQMMLDIIMCIKFLPVQNKYPAPCVLCQNFNKERYNENQKVQVVDTFCIEISGMILYALHYIL